MSTTTINISLSDSLLTEADKVAEDEYRNRSELIREALRSYILAKQKLASMRDYGQQQAKKMKITPANLPQVIASYRSK